jgi:hypothetical protein
MHKGCIVSHFVQNSIITPNLATSTKHPGPVPSPFWFCSADGSLAFCRENSSSAHVKDKLSSEASSVFHLKEAQIPQPERLI